MSSLALTMMIMSMINVGIILLVPGLLVKMMSSNNLVHLYNGFRRTYSDHRWVRREKIESDKCRCIRETLGVWMLFHQ